MLTRYHRRKSQAGSAPGILAATVVELPELDGARIAILGLHHGELGTILHMLASGVTLEGDWKYARGVRPLPMLWICDSSGRWHAMRTNRVSPSRNSGEVMLWLQIVPPLDRGTARIDVVAIGRSAQVRVRLPLCWK
jgi:hypothetical protein